MFHMKAKTEVMAKAGKSKPDEFGGKDVLRVARDVVRRGPVCDHCLGRQLARVSTGMTNLERGMILRKLLGAGREPATCGVCSGIFARIDEYAKAAASRLSKIEYATFLVGTKLSCDLVAAEESLWEDAGIEHCESIKSELNRELGKLIYKAVNRRGASHEVDEKSPDVLVILNLVKERIDLEIKPLFIRGAYKKLVRGIPQTKWDKYSESVEDIIAAPLMLATGGDAHSMHAAGREDIDARCLDWRPFVMEISNPARRKPDLDAVMKAVKKSRKAEVSELAFTERKEVAALKDARHDKSYSVVAEFEKPVKESELKALARLKGCVSQRTPVRVAHRRADKVRKRKVLDVSWKKINNKKVEFKIKGQAGLYIKELVTGDGGRTKPSVSGLLGNAAAVRSLDVIRIWR
jgi:tRNA pseudouridine synthase 10